MHVTDPRELELPAVGMLAVVDTETGRQRYVQTSSPALRARYAAAAQQRHADIARAHRVQRRRVPAPVDVARLAHRHRPVRRPAARAGAARRSSATARPCPRATRSAVTRSRGPHDDLPVRLASRPAPGPRGARSSRTCSCSGAGTPRCCASPASTCSTRSRPGGPGWQRHVPAAALLRRAGRAHARVRPAGHGHADGEGARHDHAHARHLRLDDARPTSPRRGWRRWRSRPRPFVKNLPDGHPDRPGHASTATRGCSSRRAPTPRPCSTRSAR